MCSQIPATCCNSSLRNISTEFLSLSSFLQHRAPPHVFYYQSTLALFCYASSCGARNFPFSQSPGIYSTEANSKHLKNLLHIMCIGEAVQSQKHTPHNSKLTFSTFLTSCTFTKTYLPLEYRIQSAVFWSFYGIFKGLQKDNF